MDIVHVKECEVCREELLIVTEGDGERVIATDRKDGKRHVCFDLPQDAVLIVMEDH